MGNLVRVGRSLLFSTALGILFVAAFMHLAPSPQAIAAAGDIFCVVPPGSPTGPFPTCTRVFTSPQVAVDATIGGEEIRVATGIYTDVRLRVSTPQVVYISTSLTLRGGYRVPFTAPPVTTPDLTVFDAEYRGGVLVVGAPDAQVRVENLRLTRGSGFTALGTAPAPGLYNRGVVTISDSRIDANMAGAFGNGGIVNDGRMTLVRVEVSANQAFEGNGGGIVNNGELTMRASRVVSNSNGGFFGSGGGIANQGTLYLADSFVGYNVATTPGGGLTNAGEHTAVVERTTFAANQARFGGGAIDNQGILTIANSTIASNTIFVDDACCGDAVGGGGILNDGVLALRTTTIAANETLSDTLPGGGLYNRGTASYVNTVLAGNRRAGMPDDCATSGSGSTTSLGHNLPGTGCLPVASDLSVPPDEIFTTVLLAQPLDDWSTVPFVLRNGSPAVDAGDNATCPSPDQRGFPRPVAGTPGGAARCDIGAYEFSLDGLWLARILR